MRSFWMGCAVIASLVSSQALAKDIDSIDLFAGDFIGIATVDMSKLANNKMLQDVVDGSAGDDVAQIVNEFKAIGLDVKKDIAMVTVAATEKGKICLAVDAKKSLKEAWPKFVAAEKLTPSEGKGITVYSDKENSYALVSDTRIIGCEQALNIQPILENASAAKPKTLKDRDSAVYNAYAKTSKAADIRIGAKMTKSLKDSYGKYSLDDGTGKSVKVSDLDAASVSLNLSKGLNLEVTAKAHTAESAANGATILTAQVGGVLSDPSMAELGLGFLASAVKFSAAKDQLTATVKLTDEQIATISMLLTQLAAPAAPAAATK